MKGFQEHNKASWIFLHTDKDSSIFSTGVGSFDGLCEAPRGFVGFAHVYRYTYIHFNFFLYRHMESLRALTNSQRPQEALQSLQVSRGFMKPLWFCTHILTFWISYRCRKPLMGFACPWSILGPHKVQGLWSAWWSPESIKSFTNPSEDFDGLHKVLDGFVYIHISERFGFLLQICTTLMGIMMLQGPWGASTGYVKPLVIDNTYTHVNILHGGFGGKEVLKSLKELFWEWYEMSKIYTENFFANIPSLGMNSLNIIVLKIVWNDHMSSAMKTHFPAPPSTEDRA